MKLLLETSQVLPLVTVGITFRAGRADEPADRAGLARVTCKMVRRGGEGGKEVEHRLDRLGAELSEYAGLGVTTFSCEVLARSVDAAVALMADLLGRPCSDPKELGRAVRQSKASLVRSRDDDALLCGRALRRHLFANHPHGERVLGTLTGLDAIDSEAVASFGARHYTRQNATVHISGAVTETGAEAIADRLLDALPEGEVIPYPAPAPTRASGRRLVIVHKENRSQTQLGIGTLGAHASDEDYFPLLLANAVFGGTFTSRLTRAIRSDRGWSYGASSSLTVGRVREAFTMWTAPAVDDAADCLALELSLLEAWHQRGITEEELTGCRGFLARSYAFEVDTPAKRLMQKLERALLSLPDDFHSGYLERIRAVTLEQANAAIQHRISPQNLWIAAVANADEMQPELAGACGDLAESVVDAIDIV